MAEKHKNQAFISAENVRAVYSGRPGCMCGCRGNWTYNPEHREEVEAARNTDGLTFNRGTITRIVNTVNAKIAESGERNAAVAESYYEPAVEFRLYPFGVYVEDYDTGRCWVIHWTA